MNKEDLDEDYYLKLVATGNVACLIEEYTVYSRQFGMCIPRDKKINKLLPKKTKGRTDQITEPQNYFYR